MVSLFTSMASAKYMVMLPFSLLLLTNVAAHGGEDGGGMSNVQVLISSLIGAVIVFLSAGKISKFELEGNQRLILTLAFFTGIVHILLGLKDTLLLVGGIGVIAISSPRLFSQSIHSMYRINLIILGVAISTIFIAYFVSNHSLHYIVEDYLGIVTKLTELGILILIGIEYKNNAARTDSNIVPS